MGGAPAADVAAISGRNLSCVDVNACPVCRSTKSAFFVGAEDLLHAVPGTYSYRRCLACDSVYQAPRVRDDLLPSCYPASYFTHTPGADPEISADGVVKFLRGALMSRRRPGAAPLQRLVGHFAAAVPPVHRRLLYGMPSDVEMWPGASACLEIGPGRGENLRRLVALGWEAAGVDIDAAAAEAASALSGRPVLVGTLDQVDDRFDLIFSSHSLEHMPDFRVALKTIAKLLNPGGRLYAVLPNGQSLVTKLNRSLSVNLDPPRHLVLPSVAGIRYAAAESGLKLVRLRSSATRAAHFSSIARARRSGISGTEAWSADASLRDSAMKVVETMACQIGRHLGEEIVFTAVRDE